MLTRGYFIGEIVDSLSDVAGQVSTRGRLGLTDLNKHAEDFFKTILNQLYGYSLRNLNEGRSNEPGLDLGDKTNGVAFQVTAERTSKKVNETLAKLSDQQIADYPDIRVLMIAGKQSSYTLDEVAATRVGFSVDDIWDVDVLCKRCMDLPIDVLQTLYNYVRAELAHVKIDLEIPDETGKYPTNIADYIEAIAKPTMSDFVKFNAYLEESGMREALPDTVERFVELSRELAKLPRITREFLTFMIERREEQGRHGLGWIDRIEINADKLQRLSRYPETEGELRVLQSYDFISPDEPTDQGESWHWRVALPGCPTDVAMLFLEFANANEIPLARPIMSLDFTGF